MFISIDPGKRVGVSSFTDEGKDIGTQIFMVDSTFKTFLKGIYEYSKANNEMIRFLYEDYTLRQDKAIAQTGSNMPASRAIGMVEMIHWMLGEKSTLDKSSPRNIITAFKWDGRKDIASRMERDRNYHPDDGLVAHAHGVMHLINLNIRKHPIFES